MIDFHIYHIYVMNGFFKECHVIVIVHVQKHGTFLVHGFSVLTIKQTNAQE